MAPLLSEKAERIRSAAAPGSLELSLVEQLLLPLTTEQLLQQVLVAAFPNRCAVTTSFGTESAVLLALISKIAPATPIIFLNTEYLFPQTLTYGRKLVDQLGLTSLRIVKPDPADLEREDPGGNLHTTASNRCCYLRKQLPLEKAIAEFDVWISGRKRHQGGREDLPRMEFDGNRLKINPLADWSENRVSRFFDDHSLPRHPLVKQGFRSIGCFPCTLPTPPGEDSRAGRWAGMEKTECGIHCGSGA